MLGSLVVADKGRAAWGYPRHSLTAAADFEWSVVQLHRVHQLLHALLQVRHAGRSFATGHRVVQFVRHDVVHGVQRLSVAVTIHLVLGVLLLILVSAGRQSAALAILVLHAPTHLRGALARDHG